MLNGKLLLISTGITFLLCGAVIYFCNTRLQHLEAAVLKQNQVLASFFATVQTDIKGQGQGPFNLATPEAVAAAQRFHQQPPAPFQKIAVSDTESLSDDSSSDDSDDESDSESVSDNNDGDDDSEIVSDSEDVTSTSTAIKIINLHKTDEEADLKVDIEEEDVSMYQIETFEINADVVEEEDKEEISAVVVDVDVGEGEQSINNDDFIKVVEIASFTSTSVPPPKYDSLKVDDLRKIVQDKKLATPNDVKKMKKAELLALLV